MTDNTGPLASAIAELIASALKNTTSNTPESVFESLALATATFIAGSKGSPVDHRLVAERFHEQVMAEIPRARHRLTAISRTSYRG